MAYELTIVQTPKYVHARATGERTPENALRFLREAHAACMKANQPALLLEMRLAGPSLDSSSIYQVISTRTAEGSMLRRIAYVEAVVDDPQKPRFAETVALNRGVNVRLFPDVAAAAKWLEDEP